jgi:hypothetical protein
VKYLGPNANDDSPLRAALGLITSLILVFWLSGSFYKGIRLFYTGKAETLIINKVTPKSFNNKWENLYLINNNRFIKIPKQHNVNLNVGKSIKIYYSPNLKYGIHVESNKVPLMTILSDILYNSKVLITLFCLFIISFIAVAFIVNYKKISKAITFNNKVYRKKTNVEYHSAVIIFSTQIVLCYLMSLAFFLLLLKACYSVENSNILLVGVFTMLTLLITFYSPIFLVQLLISFQHGKSQIIKLVKALVPIISSGYFLIGIIHFLFTVDISKKENIISVLKELIKKLFNF